MTTPHPEPERDIDDYEAEFKKLDQRIASGEDTSAKPGPPDNDPKRKEVRVQFRGIADEEGNPYLQIWVNDQIVVDIEAKNLAFLASALPALGAEGNTMVTWGYLPPPE